MTSKELAKIIDAARCKVIGGEDAGNAGHRLSLATLIQAFNNTESAILCEPSLARKTRRPPDIVLIDPEIGVHVFEVKGIALEQIARIEAGGKLHIQFDTNVRVVDPVVQVRNAMFDIKHATSQAFSGDVTLPLKYWVVFPFIKRTAWTARVGDGGFWPPEYLFAEALDAATLARRLGASDRQASTSPINTCPLAQLDCVWQAFGDTSVLYCAPEERERRRTSDGTLGDQFDELAETHKTLSSEQQRLSEMNWDGAPRQIRGVAGSGKTVVLANNIARNLERRLIAASEDLFESPKTSSRLLTVCFNRTLVPLIRKKISLAFQQRNGREVPWQHVDVMNFEKLMRHLADHGVWKIQEIESVDQIVRALNYTAELEDFRKLNPGRLKDLQYDAIYIDEGQDFHEEEFRLLKDLCRVKEGAEPNLYVFYDDAQNIFGRRRPNWQSLGINVRGGRSYVMSQCFRNTRQVLEAAFNVLYGTCATAEVQVPTKDFGDISALQEKGLIVDDNSFWRVKFATRDGSAPRITVARNLPQENQMVTQRLRWLIAEQQVRPEDILILANRRARAIELAAAIEAARIPSVSSVQIAFNERDKALGQKNRLTVSTVASAKGYDAYCVLLVSANEFWPDVRGRATFYVGCTRAIEYLEVFAYERKGLVVELEAALTKVQT